MFLKYVYIVYYCGIIKEKEGYKMQKYTSKNTSINTTKLPSIYSKIQFKPESLILDYGCGRKIDHIKAYVESKGCKYLPYDPYWCPNLDLTHTIDYVICSNVLNVIDDLEEVKKVIRFCCMLAPKVYFSIYEGDKSGIGKITKKDCYQRNQKLDFYLDLMKSMAIKAIKEHGIIRVEI